MVVVVDAGTSLGKEAALGMLPQESGNPVPALCRSLYGTQTFLLIGIYEYVIA